MSMSGSATDRFHVVSMLPIMMRMAAAVAVTVAMVIIDMLFCVLFSASSVAMCVLMCMTVTAVILWRTCTGTGTGTTSVRMSVPSSSSPSVAMSVVVAQHLQEYNVHHLVVEIHRMDQTISNEYTVRRLVCCAKHRRPYVDSYSVTNARRKT
jgi:hypothetical protein